MNKILYCASCRRSNKKGPNSTETFVDHGVLWCGSCANILHTSSGAKGIVLPSPGRMHESLEEDPLAAWEDCYVKKIKKRISVKNAKAEIQRAWEIWEENKNRNEAKFIFYGWLTRYRPYFLTFHCKGDPWQTVHGWLNQYENNKQKR